MKSKFIDLVAICIVAVLSLTLLFQSPVSAFEGDEGSSGLSREFASGKVKPSLIPSDGFKVPDDKIPKFPGNEKASSARKPICAGSDCPPSNVEKLSKEIREILRE